MKKKDDPNRLQGHVGSAEVGAVVEVYCPAIDEWHRGRITKIFEEKVGVVCSPLSFVAFISISDKDFTLTINYCVCYVEGHYS